MRTIKFRGYHTTQKKMFSAEEMAKDDLTISTLGCFINVSGRSTRESITYNREDFIPLQFTGLHDKNGKEIYEGDILFKFGVDDAPYVVKFGEQSVSHDWLGVGFYTEHNGEIENIFGGEYIEVIGNIYENPNLIV